MLKALVAVELPFQFNSMKKYCKNMRKVFVLFILLWSGLLSAYDVKIKVYLEGPYESHGMKAMLVNELKKHHAQVPNDAVDVVDVEIRTSPQSPAVEVKKAYLLKDGTVVDYLNPSQASLHFQASGNAYHIVVKHRNHLPIASAKTITTGALADLTLPQNVFGETKVLQGQAVMIAGNAHNDTNDLNEINASDYFAVSSANDQKVSGYLLEDLNLDGIVNEKDFQLVKENSQKLYFSNIQ